MTMIAFRVDRDRAEIVTDSVSYDLGLRETGTTSKTLLLQHLNAAVMVQGPLGLGMLWRLNLGNLDTLDSLDDLDEHAQQALPGLWAQLDLPAGVEGTVFHVGWSPRRQRYVAHAYRSTDGFALHDLSDAGLQSIPAAPAAPAGADPQTDDEWVAFAEAMFEQHSLAPVFTGRKVLIAGDVHHTTLTPGMAVQRRLHSLPGHTSHPLFRKALIGTLHKWGQLGFCWCGSGARQIDCCLPKTPEYRAACPCGSGVTFDRCHLVDRAGEDAREALALQQWTDDDERTVSDLREEFAEYVREVRAAGPQLAGTLEGA